MSIRNNRGTPTAACTRLNHLSFIIVNHHSAIGIFGLTDWEVMFFKQFTSDFITDFREVTGYNQIIITRFNFQVALLVQLLVQFLV